MKIECPHCQYSKEIADEKLPPLPANVTCPQCSQSFTLEAQDTPIMAEPLLSEMPTPPTPPAAPVPPRPTPMAPRVEEQPAGFWLRVLASIIDSVLSSLIFYAMVFGLHMVMGGVDFEDHSTGIILMLMSMMVSIVYYVFFTGYNGQTPGKMALRIKVIDNDGSSVSYGQAFVREVIGKFLSGLILCIGYLMVAFRADKRGLHDLVARTRVIKL